MTEPYTDVDQYLSATTFGPDPFAHFIERSTAAGLPEIQVSAVFGRLLELLVQLTSARTVLEVGTLGGYSAAWFARSLPEGGRVITLEIDPHHAATARENLDGVGLGGKVEIRVGPAVDTLQGFVDDAAMAGAVDLAFIDADKSNNPTYVRLCAGLVRPGGLLMVDNVVRRGSVLEANSGDANVQGTRGALELLGALDDFTATALQTVGVKGWDGFAIARKHA